MNKSFKTVSNSVLGKLKTNVLIDIVEDWIFEEYTSRPYTDLFLYIKDLRENSRARYKQGYTSFVGEHTRMEIAQAVQAVAMRKIKFMEIAAEVNECEDWRFVSEVNFKEGPSAHTAIVVCVNYVGRYQIACGILIDSEIARQTATSEALSFLYLMAGRLDQPNTLLTNLRDIGISRFVLYDESTSEDRLIIRYVDKPFRLKLFDSITDWYKNDPNATEPP